MSDLSTTTQEVFKTCNKCGLNLLLTSFSPDKNKPLGVIYSCKACTAAKARDRRKTYENTEDFKERARLRAALWRLENPVRNSEMKKSWAKQHRPTKMAANARYRSSKRNAAPPWLSDTHHKEIKDLYWLAQDLQKVTGESYHVDHIVPLKGDGVCGLHVPWNLQILPWDVNLSKKNRLNG